jgi:hypothetical protein
METNAKRCSNMLESHESVWFEALGKTGAAIPPYITKAGTVDSTVPALFVFTSIELLLVGLDQHV